MNTSVALRAALVLLAAALSISCTSTRVDDRRDRGTLDNFETLQSFTRQSIDGANRHIALSGPAQCNVKVVQLTYDSIGVHGEPVKLSAGMYIPDDCPGPFPLLAEAHGTESDRKHLATNVGPGSTSVAFFAARGYVVVVADYLGLGKSDYPYHPYLHADSEASAIIDSIRAAKSTAQQLNVSMDYRLMLFGYSQGGHAAMAAQREIEQHHRNEFNLVAAAPMAGPYHLSQTFLSSWFGYTGGGENTLASELLSYTVVSYNRIYGTLYKRPGQLFAERYATQVESLFPGDLNLFEISKRQLLPAYRLNDLRTPQFTASFILDEQQPFRAALRKNDLLDWTPTTRTVLCGSRRDSIVDFQNTYAAEASFRARGKDVTVIDIADDIPASADGVAHHTKYAFLCYAKVRTQLFDPIARPQAVQNEHSG